MLKNIFKHTLCICNLGKVFVVDNHEVLRYTSWYMNMNLLRVYEKKKLFDAKKPFSKTVVANMNDWFKVELTYTSNAIEGNTLSRQETALVVEKGITVEGKTVQEHLEAINHAKSFDFIQTLIHGSHKKITEQDVLEIHKIILQGIDDLNAGRYRTVAVRIAGSTVILPNPMKVPELMEEFIIWLNGATKDIIDIAAEAHFKFVCIHPFVDGNGRTARLLMNLILMQAGFPPAIIRKEDRMQYITSIERAQMTKDTSAFKEIIYEAVSRSLDLFFEKEEPQTTAFLTIGKLAKATNETVATIRYWTKEGLLPVAKRSNGGYQLYASDVIQKIEQIRVFQKQQRLTIEELKKKL